MTKTNAILEKLPRFKRPDSENLFTPSDKLGTLIGVYDNYPFGDDLYLYDQAIYWNVDSVNYCFFFHELESVVMDSQTDQHIRATLSGGETLSLPVRGHNDSLNEACKFLTFLQAVIDTNSL